MNKQNLIGCILLFLMVLQISLYSTNKSFGSSFQYLIFSLMLTCFFPFYYNSELKVI